MLATIKKSDLGFLAKFERKFENSVEAVWAVLIENDKLAKWMSNLKVMDLRKGGVIQFDMQDDSGTFIDMEIIDFKHGTVLEFVWGEDRVRFEVHATEDQTNLTLTEYIGTLTDHTAKDLAGWHVCLDMFAAVLADQPIDFPMDRWQKWYENYQVAVEGFNDNSNSSL